jgi:signal transduction histidine kinase
MIGRLALSSPNERISIRRRLTVLVVVFALPLTLLLGLFLQQSWDDVVQVDREIAGARYLADIWPLVLDGPVDPAVVKTFAQDRARFDGPMGTGAESRRLLAARSPQERNDAVNILMGSVMGRSQLALDSDLTTSSLGDATAVILPILFNRLAAWNRALGAPEGAPRQIAVDVALWRSLYAARSAAATIDLAMNAAASPAGRRAIAPAAADADAVLNYLQGRTSALTDRTASASAQGPPPELAVRIAHAWRTTNAQLQKALTLKRARLFARIGLSLAFVALALSVASGMAISIAYGVWRRIVGLARAVDQLNNKIFNVQVPFQGDQTEIGRIARSIEALRISVPQLVETRAELLHLSRLTSMGRTAAALAHELNQPLAAIRNYLAAGRRLTASGDTDRAAEASARALAQVEHAATVVLGLHDFMRKGGGERREEDFAKVLKEAEAMALIGQRGRVVKIAHRLDPLAAAMVIDRIQVQQVLVNLLRNGIEALAGSDRRELVVQTRRLPDGMVEVAVTDTGSGIDAAVKARLFEPFVTNKPSGMGMGLSICRSIIEGHGGRLWAEDNPEGGSIFRFTVPGAAQEDLQTIKYRSHSPDSAKRIDPAQI